MDLPVPRVEPGSPALQADSLPLEPLKKDFPEKDGDPFQNHLFQTGIQQSHSVWVNERRGEKERETLSYVKKTPVVKAEWAQRNLMCYSP